jgi:hypothetical protein
MEAQHGDGQKHKDEFEGVEKHRVRQGQSIKAA